MMCGRFTLFDDADILEINLIIQHVQNKISSGIQLKTGEIFPTNTTVTLKGNGSELEPVAMKWGFPKWDGKGVIINAKSETAAEKKTFAKPLRESRCVIPSTGFYEWDGDKNKYLFRLEAEQTPIVYMAGIYNVFRKGGEEYRAFTIFTRDANSSIKDIHNRMPVILYQHEIEDFINQPGFSEYAFRRDDVKLNRTIVT